MNNTNENSKSFHDRAKTIAEKSLARAKGDAVPQTSSATPTPVVSAQTTNQTPNVNSAPPAPNEQVPNMETNFPDITLNNLPDNNSKDFEYDIDPAPSEEEIKAESTPPPVDNSSSESSEDADEEFPDLPEGQSSAAENFKKLRKKYKYTKEEAKTAREELASTKAKLEEYESGLTVPEVTQQLNNRIAQLETYEKIFNLKTTPEYIEKVTTPLNDQFKALNEYVAEYKAEPEIIEAALGATTKAERNRLLARAGLDPVAALEVSNVIGKIKDLNNYAVELEKEPAKSLEKLVEDNMRIKGEREKEQRAAIATTSKNMWIESVQDVRSQDKYPELTMIPGNTEHNEKFVKPVLQKAATEYGRLINGLVGAGLKELPAPIGKALARMTKLAIGGAVIREQNKILQERIAELEGSIKTKNSHYRPGAHGAHVAAQPNRTDSSAPKEHPAMRAYNRAHGIK